MLVVMKKLIYDEEYNFENEGEDEVMFVEYRKQLKLLLDRFVQVFLEFVLVFVCRVFSVMLQNWQIMCFMEVEVVVWLLYMLVEVFLVFYGVYFLGDVLKVSVLQDMMWMLVILGVSFYQYMFVILEFFEIVVCYEKFFIVEFQYILCVFMVFLDYRGLWYFSVKVWSRIVYLFFRFVKFFNK